MKTRLLTRVFDGEMKSVLQKVKSGFCDSISVWEAAAYKVEISIPEEEDTECQAVIKFYCITPSKLEYTVAVSMDPRLIQNVVK